ncbi:hypothetical protein V6C53_08730 [Desulfocurvibacter africanus]|uniref:hypothetical protein n=1 Tax=Desulfocurvibacter africanus TaxID=873 RepID=UPI002FDA97F8
MLIRVEAVRPGTVPAEMRYYIDKPLTGEVLANDSPLVLRGWVWSPNDSIEGVEARTESGECIFQTLNQYRPALNKQLGLAEDVALGFRLDLKARPDTGRVVLRGLGSRAAHVLCSIDMRGMDESKAEERPKQLFFMHIAKTAGSSVNALVQQYYPPERCVSHVESYHLRPDMNVLNLQDKLYVSGHVTLEVARRRRYIADGCKTFTLLRKPASHLLSHIAWVKRLGLPEYAREYAAHPAHIQELARMMNAMSFEEFIGCMGEMGHNLFDNVQTRYLASAFSCLLDDGHLEQALATLRTFDIVGLNEEFDRSMRLLARSMGWGEPAILPRENVASYKCTWRELGIGPDHPLLRKLLRYDDEVYAEACRLFDQARNSWLCPEVAE